jgi:hypothetical protein
MPGVVAVIDLKLAVAVFQTSRTSTSDRNYGKSEVRVALKGLAVRARTEVPGQFLAVLERK